MPRIVFLIAETDTLVDGNYLRLGNALLARGSSPVFCLIDSLAMYHSRVVAKGFSVDQAIHDGEPFPELRPFDLAEFDVIWVLSLGLRQSFLDKMQLLHAIGEETRIINSLDAIMHLKSKYFLAGKPDRFHYPETHASTDPDELFRVIGDGGKWIAKPPAGSLGRDVFLLEREDANVRVILNSLCGPDQDRYVLLQRYVAEIEAGEKRILLAGGKPVGQYRRLQDADHRTNLNTGARIEPCDLTPEETACCFRLGSLLQDMGAEFVGLDLAWPWVIEFNVINPGGLLTIEQLTGQDLSEAILDEIASLA